MNEPLKIVPEDTPNPNSNKFTLNRTLLSHAGVDFPNRTAGASSPLARELFLLDSVSGVYIGPNFVTVSLKDAADWWTLRPLIMQTIETHVASGIPAVSDGTQAPAPAASRTFSSAVEAGINQILETEIQPAVAMDGGHIAFVGYEKGVVRLQLRGACHSCPSSMVTLKMGIENRLKQEFPEIVAVEAV